MTYQVMENIWFSKNCKLDLNCDDLVREVIISFSINHYENFVRPWYYENQKGILLQSTIDPLFCSFAQTYWTLFLIKQGHSVCLAKENSGLPNPPIFLEISQMKFIPWEYSCDEEYLYRTWFETLLVSTLKILCNKMK